MKRIDPQSVQASDGKVGAIAVPGNVNRWTKTTLIAFGDVFCLSLKATKTSGNIDVTVSLEQSFEEASANDSTDASYKLPEGRSASIIQLTDNAWHHIAVSPDVLPYLRLKLAGGAGNHASVTVDARLSKQEEF